VREGNEKFTDQLEVRREYVPAFLLASPEKMGY